MPLTNSLVQPKQKSVLDKNVAKAILKTLAYFDLFNYPLTNKEIYEFSELKESEEVFENCITELLIEKIIFTTGSYLSLNNNPLLAIKRNQENKIAMEQLPQAIAIGKFIYRIPFVRAVGISGSLSKNVAYEKSDFDYFIITQKNRLWFCRFLLMLHRRWNNLKGGDVKVCCNYLIDESALTILEKNFYTAIEIASLIPVAGSETLVAFYKANEWSNSIFPNKKNITKKETIKNYIRPIIELLFKNFIGTKADNFFKKLSYHRFQQKIKRKENINIRGEFFYLHTDKHFCKNAPSGFQKRILALYADKIRSLELKYTTRISN